LIPLYKNQQAVNKHHTVSAKKRARQRKNRQIFAFGADLANITLPNVESWQDYALTSFLFF
jgi:hypothetical protein